METRLCNIFKTANAIKLVKTILERPYKIRQDSSKRNYLQKNGTIFKGRSILNYFQKQRNYIFWEVHLDVLKQVENDVRTATQ